jgi:GTPase
MINDELMQFNPALMEKPQIVAINKLDLPITRERLKKDIDIFAGKDIEVFAFSAVTGEGRDTVFKAVIKVLNAARQAKE